MARRGPAVATPPARRDVAESRPEPVLHASIGFRSMGILDDAIREHLDLKRKHGAAEDELQRQEEEALGPARREVAPAQAQDTNGAGESAAAEASPDAADEPAGERQAAEPSTEAEAEAHTDPAIDAAPPTAAEEPQVEPEPPEAEPEADAVPEPLPPEPAPEPVATEPEPEPEPEPPPVEAPYDAASHEETSVPAADTPPLGFEAPDEEVDELFADERPSEGEEGDEGEKEEDEDVLQDTPDFLQETPEHDRLWFEQKPPRDFDFD